MLSKNKISKYKFDTKKFPFREIFNNFSIKNCGLGIDELHKTKIQDLIPQEILKTGDDSKQPYCEFFYNIDDEFDSFDRRLENKFIKENTFMKIYRSLINDLKDNLFKDEIVYQKKPTIRVHLPGNVSTGTYHRDSDYGHSIEEINFWLPLVNVQKTTSLYIEDDYMSENYKPIELNYGEILIFNSLLKHGTEINTENYTRVSFDFRIMLASQYQENSKVSYVRNKQFIIGSYYEKL
tara:strand:+ start:25368 stop:26078 length:711 start_codon:yes stop_codon:yes gene_type:complete